MTSERVHDLPPLLCASDAWQTHTATMARGVTLMFAFGLPMVWALCWALHIESQAVGALLMAAIIGTATFSLWTLDDDHEPYTIWLRWYFTEEHMSFSDWLDVEYITHKPKRTYKKRKPADMSLQALVNTEDEQRVFDLWYESEWRAEYRDWAQDVHGVAL